MDVKNDFRPALDLISQDVESTLKGLYFTSSSIEQSSDMATEIIIQKGSERLLECFEDGHSQMAYKSLILNCIFFLEAAISRFVEGLINLHPVDQQTLKISLKIKADLYLRGASDPL